MLAGARRLRPGGMPVSTAIAIFATITYRLMGIAVFRVPEWRDGALAS